MTKFLQNILHKKPVVIYGSGTQTRDFISIHDVVDAFSCAIDANKNGTYNIASGRSLSINELAHMMFNVFENTGIIYESKKQGDIQDSVADTTFSKNELNFVARRKLEDELTSL